jgi:hypothetical protein
VRSNPVPFQSVTSAYGISNASCLSVSFYPAPDRISSNGRTEAIYLTLPPQWEQLNGFGGSILILGTTISKTNANSMRVAIFSKETEEPGS